jgi:hypothetical protein
MKGGRGRWGWMAGKQERVNRLSALPPVPYLAHRSYLPHLAHLPYPAHLRYLPL